MDTGILLESGTNELEILEFRVGDNFYGVNVAKVREILPYCSPTTVPNSHPWIEGIFMPREKIITIVNLRKCFKLPEDAGGIRKDMYIVMNFNQLNVAFHVDQVCGIQRVSWKSISKPDATLGNAEHGLATGIIKLSDHLIMILDFERIITSISPETGLQVDEIANLGTRKRVTIPILMAEDSAMLGKMIRDCLLQAGYTSITSVSDGAQAWKKLCEYRDAKTIDENIGLVITDIEMPQMDGHHLLKLIKEDKDLAKLPVVIFSSLVNEEMRKKGEQLGADAQLSKPEIGELVKKLDELLQI